MATQKLKIKKSSLAKLSPGDIATILRYNKMLANRTGQVIRAGDVVRVPKNTLTTNTMTTNSYGGVTGTSGGILAGGTGSGYGTKGTGGTNQKKSAPKPKKVTPILKVNKPNPKPKPKPKKPTPLKPAVAPRPSPIQPQVARVVSPQYALPPRPQAATPRQYSPLGGGGYSYGVPYTPVMRPYATTQAQNANNAYNVTQQAMAMAAQGQFVPRTSGGMGTVAPYRPQPAGMPNLPQPAGTAQRQQNPAAVALQRPSIAPTASVTATGIRAPSPDYLAYYAPRPNPLYTLVSMEHLAELANALSAGYRPLVIPDNAKAQLGLTDDASVAEFMESWGYTMDAYGNLVRLEKQGDNSAGTGTGNGGRLGGYLGYGGGGGWVGYGDGGGGYGYSPAEEQRRYGIEMGAVTW